MGSADAADIHPAVAAAIHAARSPEPLPKDLLVVNELAAGLDVRPPFGVVVAEESAELMGVRTCKTGCGRWVARGTTRSCKGFGTCRRGYLLGQAHHKLCGVIDPAQVGESPCRKGYGRLVSVGTDKSGLKHLHCCHGCTHGDSHDDWCKLARYN